jgi:hypothetical protein
MNMNKMRGFADPYTLGFILAAVIATAGVTTEKQQEIKTQTQQASYVQQKATPQAQTINQKETNPFTMQ